GTAARILDDGRTSGCQVRGGAVAEPARPGLDIDALRRRELTTGPLHVSAKGVGIAGHRSGIRQPPSVCLQKLHIGLVIRMDVERRLQRGGQTARQSGEAAELVRLLTVQAAVVLEAAVAATPACDS